MGKRTDEIAPLEPTQADPALPTLHNRVEAQAGASTYSDGDSVTGEVLPTKAEIVPAKTPAGDTDDMATIQAQIEQTRSEMSDTIEAIKAKLSPQHLAEEARDATLGKVEQVVGDTLHSAVEQAHEMVDRVRDKAKEATNGVAQAAIQFIDILRDNPLPTVVTCIALVGIVGVRARK